MRRSQTRSEELEDAGASFQPKTDIIDLAAAIERGDMSGARDALDHLARFRPNMREFIAQARASVKARAIDIAQPDCGEGEEEPFFDLGDLIEVSAAIRRDDRVTAELYLDRIFEPYAGASEAIANGRYGRKARVAA